MKTASLVTVSVSLFLCACAATDPAPVIDATARTGAAGGSAGAALSSPAVSLDPVAALSRLGAPDSINTRQAASLLGPPDVDRRDGAGALLTWRLSTCALVLGFANDRLTSTVPMARQSGAPAPSVAACVNEARARRPQS